MCAKRLCALLLLAALCLTGCGSLNFTTAEPIEVVSFDGSTIGDRTPACTANPDLAEQLRAGIMAQQDLTLHGWDLDVISACLDELMALPDYFWFRGYHISASTGLRTTAEVTFRWLYEDGAAKYNALCAKADEILSAAPWMGDYSVALYVYDWLAANVTYAESEGYDQTAYAAVCEGSAVCGGIADAFAFLLNRAGIPACTITGQAVHEGERVTHAWNFAVLDGAVYAFDPTWDNTDRYDAAGREYLQHIWFGLTSTELNITHTPEHEQDDITALSNADNYYIHENAVITDDSPDSVVAAVRAQAEAGMNALSFRCADRTVYDAVSYRLFTLGEAGTVLRRLGLLNSGSYELTYTQQEDLFIITMYL